MLFRTSETFIDIDKNLLIARSCDLFVKLCVNWSILTLLFIYISFFISFRIDKSLNSFLFCLLCCRSLDLPNSKNPLYSDKLTLSYKLRKIDRDTCCSPLNWYTVSKNQKSVITYDPIFLFSGTIFFPSFSIQFFEYEYLGRNGKKNERNRKNIKHAHRGP